MSKCAGVKISKATLQMVQVTVTCCDVLRSNNQVNVKQYSWIQQCKLNKGLKVWKGVGGSE